MTGVFIETYITVGGSPALRSAYKVPPEAAKRMTESEVLEAAIVRLRDDWENRRAIGSRWGVSPAPLDPSEPIFPLDT